MAVRLASALDLPITAKIAHRGFNHSPWNAFYRPFAAQYPEDVELSYFREQEQALADGRKLFTVIEIVHAVENHHHHACHPSSPRMAQIVGFAIWNYPENTPCPTAGELGNVSDAPDRSVDQYRADLLFGAASAATRRYICNYMELDNMAVDPIFFRRGYGTKLCQHGMSLAMKEGMPVGIIAAAMGKELYARLGFRTVIEETVKDERPGMEAVVGFWVQVWSPTEYN